MLKCADFNVSGGERGKGMTKEAALSNKHAHRNLFTAACHFSCIWTTV